jgi:hypothetical protein
MRRALTALARAFFYWLGSKLEEYPVVEDAEELGWQKLPLHCIEVVDYTSCPAPRNLDAIENEFKELVDSLDLDGCEEGPQTLN